MEISQTLGSQFTTFRVGAYGCLEKIALKLFAHTFQLDGFLWFLGLWTTHSCRETFVTNLFTDGPMNFYSRPNSNYTVILCTTQNDSITVI